MAAACRLLLADSADRPMINHLHAQGMVVFRGRQVSGRGRNVWSRRHELYCVLRDTN